jgi:hypothetical protein
MKTFGAWRISYIHTFLIWVLDADSKTPRNKMNVVMFPQMPFAPGDGHFLFPSPSHTIIFSFWKFPVRKSSAFPVYEFLSPRPVNAGLRAAKKL